MYTDVLMSRSAGMRGSDAAAIVDNRGKMPLLRLVSLANALDRCSDPRHKNSQRKCEHDVEQQAKHVKRFKACNTAADMEGKRKPYGHFLIAT